MMYEKNYGRSISPDVVKDIKDLNEKIKKETDPDEVLKLKLQRLYKGMELNGGMGIRPFGAYFPY